MKFNCGLFLGLAVGLWFARESLQQALEAVSEEAIRERAEEMVEDWTGADTGGTVTLLN